MKHLPGCAFDANRPHESTGSCMPFCPIGGAEVRERLQAWCKHELTTAVDDPDGPGMGEIELCDACGMSRRHWEQGVSDWQWVDLADLGPPDDCQPE